jgi:hypothetical protein
MRTIIGLIFLCLVVTVQAQKKQATPPPPQQEDSFFDQFRTMQKQLQEMLKGMSFDQNNSRIYWDTTIVHNFSPDMYQDTTIFRQFSPGMPDSLSSFGLDMFPKELQQMMNQMMQQFHSFGDDQSMHLFGLPDPNAPIDPNAPRNPNFKRIVPPTTPETKPKKKTYTM